MKIHDLPSLIESSSIIYRCIYGSRAFNLATEGSDTDIRGVFVLPKEQFYGLDPVEQVSDERCNEMYWEVGRFVSLLLKNNPNALEVLSVDERFVSHKDPVFSELCLDMFLSRLSCETFAQYAATQLKKARGLNKKVTKDVEPVRKGVIDFCYVLNGYGSILLSQWLGENSLSQEQCGLVSIPHMQNLYALFVSKEGEYRGIIRSNESDEVTTSSVPNGRSPAAILSFNKDAYRRHCREYQDYWSWVEGRNEERHQTNAVAAKGYDTKNVMHVFRLIAMAEDIAHKMTVVTFRPDREELLKIKRGEREYDDLVQEAEARLRAVRDEYERSSLPPLPDRTRAIEALVRIREKIYQR